MMRRAGWQLIQTPYQYRHGDPWFLWMGACIVCGELAYEESGKIPERACLCEGCLCADDEEVEPDYEEEEDADLDFSFPEGITLESDTSFFTDLVQEPATEEGFKDPWPPGDNYWSPELDLHPSSRPVEHRARKKGARTRRPRLTHPKGYWKKTKAK
jgi:hypothetical protein